MGGNTHASALMGTDSVESEVRNVCGKTVVRELQATVMQLHTHYFSQPDDIRVRAFVEHSHAPTKPPIEASMLQTYASYMADHLELPCGAGMERVVYVLEGHSDGKHLPNGAAFRREEFRTKEYIKCTTEGAEGVDWRNCVTLHDCAVKAIIAEVACRKTKCPIIFLLPPGEADSTLAEMAKDPNNIVCVDSGDGDIGTLFFNPKDQATLHYCCKWNVTASSRKVTLHSKTTTPAQLFSKKKMVITKQKTLEIDFSLWNKVKMIGFCLAVSVNGDYIKGNLSTLLFLFCFHGNDRITVHVLLICYYNIS